MSTTTASVEAPGGASGETTPSDVPPAGSSLLSYVLRKLGGAAVSLLMVIALGYFAFKLLPGDPVTKMARTRQMTPEQMEAMREEFGLNDPWYIQFLDYLKGVFTGDFGTSYVYSRPVSELIAEFFWPTIVLTGTAALLAIALGLWMGQRAAWQRNSWFDRIATGSSLVLWSVPTFWLGLLLLMVFGGILHWFPTGGMVSSGAEPWTFGYVLDLAHHLVLPVVTMVAVVYAQYLLVMRASLLEEMTSDYLTTARAKGLNEDGVRLRHAVPNALLPTVTLVFMHIGGLIAGAVTVETIYSWPGLGKLTFEALAGPDLPLLQGTFVVFSAIIIVMNFLADLVYRVLDPRVRRA